MGRYKLNLALIILYLVCILYAPFELTRLILAVKDGYTLYTPTYWVAELLAIWIGYILAGVLILRGLSK